MEKFGKNKSKMLGSLLVIFAYTAYFFFQESHKNYWTIQKDFNSRAPASDPGSISGTNFRIYEDFFTHEHYRKLLHFDLDIKVLSSNNKKASLEFKNRINQIFKESLDLYNFAKNRDLKSISLITTNKDFIQNLIDQIVVGLRSAPTETKEISFQIQFKPKHNTRVLPNEGLQQLHIMNLNNLDFYKRFKERKLSLVDRIFQMDLPSDGSMYQYMGGEIQIDIKVDPTYFDSRINFRRYYRINRPKWVKIKLGPENFKEKFTIFKPKNKNDTLCLSEILETYSQDDDQLKLKVFSFKLVQKEQESKKENFNHGLLVSRGWYGNSKSKKVPVIFKVHKFDYSFENQRFLGSSKLSFKIIGVKDQTPFKDFFEKIKVEILNKNKQKIIEQYDFKRFHEDII